MAKLVSAASNRSIIALSIATGSCRTLADIRMNSAIEAVGYNERTAEARNRGLDLVAMCNQPCATSIGTAFLLRHSTVTRGYSRSDWSRRTAGAYLEFQKWGFNCVPQISGNWKPTSKASSANIFNFIEIVIRFCLLLPKKMKQKVYRVSQKSSPPETFLENIFACGEPV